MNFETLKRLNDAEERIAQLERRLQDLEARMPSREVHEAVAELAANPRSRPILGLRKKNA